MVVDKDWNLSKIKKIFGDLLLRMIRLYRATQLNNRQTAAAAVQRLATRDYCTQHLDFWDLSED